MRWCQSGCIPCHGSDTRSRPQPHPPDAAFGLYLTETYWSRGVQRLTFVVWHPSSDICHLISVICHLSSVICHPSSVICHLTSVIRHLSSVICHSSSVMVIDLSPVICFGGRGHGCGFVSTFCSRAFIEREDYHHQNYPLLLVWHAVSNKNRAAWTSHSKLTTSRPNNTSRLRVTSLPRGQLVSPLTPTPPPLPNPNPNPKIETWGWSIFLYMNWNKFFKHLKKHTTINALHLAYRLFSLFKTCSRQSTARKRSWHLMWHHSILFTVSVMGQWWHHRCGKSGQMSKWPDLVPLQNCCVWKYGRHLAGMIYTIEAMNLAKLSIYLFPTFWNGLPKVLLHMRLWITMSTWTLFNGKS